MVLCRFFGRANIHFKDGKQIAKADKYEHLGGTLPRARVEMLKFPVECQKL